MERRVELLRPRSSHAPRPGFVNAERHMSAAAGDLPGPSTRVLAFASVASPFRVVPKASLNRCNCKPERYSRRELISRIVVAAGVVLRTAVNDTKPALADSSSSADADSGSWNEDALCDACSGRGTVPCGLCEGSGLLSIDDGVVEYENTCPSCAGAKTLGCLKCITTGLANTKGFLREASADGRIRMRRNGTFEVLICDSIPSCKLYGLGKKDAV